MKDIPVVNVPDYPDRVLPRRVGGGGIGGLKSIVSAATSKQGLMAPAQDVSSSGPYNFSSSVLYFISLQNQITQASLVFIYFYQSTVKLPHTFFCIILQRLFCKKKTTDHVQPLHFFFLFFQQHIPKTVFSLAVTLYNQLIGLSFFLNILWLQSRSAVFEYIYTYTRMISIYLICYSMTFL